MTPNFKTKIEENTFNTTNPDDILTHTMSVSLDEEKVYLSIEYKIFRGFKKDKDGEFLMKTQFGKPDTKIPKYSIFSVDKTFNNNYMGLGELEGIVPQFNTEQKVKEYFNL